MIIDLSPVLAAAKKVNKVWGRETWVTNTELYCVKVLEINPGYQCSLHKHLQKDEEFYVISGQVWLEVGNDLHILSPGDHMRIFPGRFHRFGSYDGAAIFEFSSHHSDDDVVRLEESRQIPQPK